MLNLYSLLNLIKVQI